MSEHQNADCTGDVGCTASPHWHGCHSDYGDCEAPGEHQTEHAGWKVSVRHGASGPDVLFDAVTDTLPPVRMSFRWSPEEAMDVADLLMNEAVRRAETKRLGASIVVEPLCDECPRITSALVHACSSVGIEHGRTTGEELRLYMEAVHAAHTPEADADGR